MIMCRSILLMISLIASFILLGCAQPSIPHPSPPPSPPQSNNGASQSSKELPPDIPQVVVIKPQLLKVEYVTNTNRLIALHDSMDEFGFYQLPYNSNEFHIQFSESMNQQSVENKIRESLGDDVSVQFAWKDTQNLLLQLSGSVKDQIYRLDVSGSLDEKGNGIVAQPVLRFTFIEPKAFYELDIGSMTETLLYAPNMMIDSARLSWNKEHIQLVDQIGIFFDPYYDRYLIDLDSFEWIHSQNPKYNDILFENQGYRANHIYRVFYADESIASVQKLTTEYGPHYQQAILSPDGRQIAIFHTDQSITTANEGTRFSIDVSIYDSKSGELLREYNGLYHDIFEHDGTDAPPPERYFHYKEKYAYWYAEDQIVVEFLSEDEQEIKIGVLHLNSGDFKHIATQRIDPVLSPNAKYIVARIWNEEQLEVMDIEGNVIDTLNTTKIDTPIWSDSGDRFMYYTPTGDVMIYEVHTKNSMKIGSNMYVAGWFDENRLLIYK